MNKQKRIIDRRLVGTWKSDRRMTFREYRPRRPLTPEKLKKLKSLFGKLVIRWGYRKVETELTGYRDKGEYKILGVDSDGVVVQIYCKLYEEERLTHIHFEGDRYWISLGNGGLREYFQRVR